MYDKNALIEFAKLALCAVALYVAALAWMVM